MKKGDKIIEVNGTNISNENHTQVVGRIKAGGSETRILVADKECVEWHLEHKQTISSSLPYVLHLSSQRSTSPVPSSSSSSSSRPPIPIRSSSFSKAGRSRPGEEVMGSTPRRALRDTRELGVPGSVSDMMAEGEVGCSDITAMYYDTLKLK